MQRVHLCLIGIGPLLKGNIGGIEERAQRCDVRLLPVTVADEASHQARGDAGTTPSRTGTINIELPGRALVSVEGSVDADIVRAVLESLRR